jgi:hypothetical protein
MTAVQCKPVYGVLGLMQGLGEGPNELLGGATDGSISLLERVHEAPDPSISFNIWCYDSVAMQPFHDVAMSCLAATDDVVVSGFNNGGLRVTHMASSFAAGKESL